MKLAAAVCALALGETALAQAWRTGADFRKQLESPVSVSWSSNPLRGALSRLSEQQRLPVFLDRRVDPGQRVDFSISNAPLDEAVRRFAAAQGLGVSYVGGVIYVGPAQTASALATVAALRREEMTRASRGGSIRGALARPLAWEELATPRELIEETARQAGCALVNAERVPHDLWAAGALPPQHAAERLTLLLAGFELSFRVLDEGRLELIPWQAPEPIVRTYPVTGDAAAAIEQIARLFPAAQVRTQQGALAVSAFAEDHEEISRLLRGERVRRRTVTAAETRYSLKMENAPVGPLLQGLAPRLNMKVEFDPSVADKLQSPVSFDVKDATLDELLNAVVQGARLAWRREGETLRILPAGQDVEAP